MIASLGTQMPARMSACTSAQEPERELEKGTPIVAWSSVSRVVRPNLRILMGVLAALRVVLLTVSAAKTQIPQDQRVAYIGVGVATLWVEPRTY
jgi:hypothetical protein